MCAWQKAHKENVNAKNRAWAKANPEKIKESAKKFYAKNKEKETIRVKEFNLANPEKLIARNLAWREANPGRLNDLSREWRLKNKGKTNSLTAKRRAHKANATPSWANLFFIEEAYNLAKIRESITGICWHVDHIVPLNGRNVCGLHVENNLQVIPAIENMAKGNRFLDELNQLTAC